MVNLCDKKSCWTCDDLCDNLCKMVDARQCNNGIFIQKSKGKNPFIQDFLHKRVIPGGRSGGLSTPKLRSQSTALKETDVIVIAHSREPWIIRRFLAMIFHKKKHPQGVFFLGGRSGTRTLGPLIKSQLLYQLS